MNFLKIFLLTVFSVFQIQAADIAIVTLVVGKKYDEATHIGLLSKAYYCKKFGYDFIVCNEHLDKTRDIPWSKILLVKNTLSKYKWVFFSDADSLIMNYSIPLSDFIDENYNMIICKDHYPKDVNTGQFFIKNTPWSFDLLSKIYNKHEYINHPYWEQEALNKLLKENHALHKKMKILSAPTFNSCLCDNFEPGQFILHLLGTRNLNLLKQKMQHYALESMNYPCNQNDQLEFLKEYVENTSK